MRQLRSYERVAQREHFCDRCCKYIMPGDRYEGTVYVHEERKKIGVFRKHIHPGCDYPWEDEDSFEYQHERELEGERENDAREEVLEIAA